MEKTPKANIKNRKRIEKQELPQYKYVESLSTLSKISISKPQHKFDDLMRFIENEEFLLHCLGSVMKNKGALTPGIDPETTDTASLNTIKEIVSDLKTNNFKFKPIKRIYIDKTGKNPKINNELIKLAKQNKLTPEKIKEMKARPLGIPSFKDKILQEAIRLVLNAIYEPIFAKNNTNFGFRPKYGCHDAIEQIFTKVKSQKYAIEADITGAFDNVDFNILINILEKKIKDKRFIKLIYGGLKCGIFFANKLSESKIGTTQGSLVSPLLYNIYFNEFDEYILNEFTTHVAEINAIEKRKDRPTASLYNYLTKKKSKLKYNDTITELRETFNTYGRDSQEFLAVYAKYSEIKKKYVKIDTIQKRTPTFKLSRQTIRFHYIRYADDWILFTNASLERTIDFKNMFTEWLTNNLKLSLSPAKTKITDLTKEHGNFLGFQFRYARSKRTQSISLEKKLKTKSSEAEWQSNPVLNQKRMYKQRTTNPSLIFAFDRSRVISRLEDKRFISKKRNQYRGRSKTEWTTLEIPDIITRYNYIIRGYANYYGPATYYSNDMFVLHYYLKYSCAHTIANKLKTSLRSVFGKFGKDISVNWINKVQRKSRKTSEVIITEVPTVTKLLNWDDVKTIINSRITDKIIKMKKKSPITPESIIHRSIDNIADIKVNWRTKFKLSKYCAICGSTDKVEYHHVKHIRIGKVEGFLQIMNQLNRKQIPCCKECHNKIHKGLYDNIALNDLYDEQLIIF